MPAITFYIRKTYLHGIAHICLPNICSSHLPVNHLPPLQSPRPLPHFPQLRMTYKPQMPPSVSCLCGALYKIKCFPSINLCQFNHQTKEPSRREKFPPPTIRTYLSRFAPWTHTTRMCSYDIFSPEPHEQSQHSELKGFSLHLLQVFLNCNAIITLWKIRNYHLTLIQEEISCNFHLALHNHTVPYRKCLRHTNSNTIAAD